MAGRPAPPSRLCAYIRATWGPNGQRGRRVERKYRSACTSGIWQSKSSAIRRLIWSVSVWCAVRLIPHCIVVWRLRVKPIWWANSRGGSSFDAGERASSTGSSRISYLHGRPPYWYIYAVKRFSVVRQKSPVSVSPRILVRCPPVESREMLLLVASCCKKWKVYQRVRWMSNNDKKLLIDTTVGALFSKQCSNRRSWLFSCPTEFFRHVFPHLQLFI